MRVARYPMSSPALEGRVPINQDAPTTDRPTVDLAACCQGLIDEFAQFITTVYSLEDGPEFHRRLAVLDALARDLPTATRQALARYALNATEAEFRQSKVISHGRRKPFGYSGDFQMIDWTYKLDVSSESERGRFWDTFYHAQIAPIAVRQRKDRFGLELIRLQVPRDKKLRILNVGSGPAREIREGLEIAHLAPDQVDIVCVDTDGDAINYAKGIIPGGYRESVSFHKGNALRYRSKSSFDLIWSAGLFDYLSEKQSIFLLTSLWQMLAPGGRLVVGNFADTHRTRPWIEWCGDWYLEHRSASDLLTVGRGAGVPSASMRTDIDPLEAIRFLVADRPVTG